MLENLSILGLFFFPPMGMFYKISVGLKYEYSCQLLIDLWFWCMSENLFPNILNNIYYNYKNLASCKK